MTLLVSETFINQTKGYQFGNTEPTEAYTDSVSDLLKSLRKEYGRISSPVCIDTKSQGAVRIGWVFEKKMEYEDAHRSRLKGDDRFYVREVWVTVYEKCDVTDPLALQKTSRSGAVTTYPFKHKRLGAA